MPEVTKELTKRDIVVQEIEKGGATVESLMAAADCKYPSIMSIFSTLRLMGKCPVRDVPMKDKKTGEEIQTYRFITLAEWEKMKEDTKANAKSRKPAKSPAENLILVEKRFDAKAKAATAAKERLDKDKDNKLLKLRLDKALIEFEITKIELSEAKTAAAKAAKADAGAKAAAGAKE